MRSCFAQTLPRSFRWCNDLAKKHRTLEIASPVLITHDTHVLYPRCRSEFNRSSCHETSSLAPVRIALLPRFRNFYMCQGARHRDRRWNGRGTRRILLRTCVRTPCSRKCPSVAMMHRVNDDLVVHQEALSLPRSLLLLLKKKKKKDEFRYK